MHALIGLGNPGRRYEDTRHNIGYLIVDHFSAFERIPFKPGKGDYYYKVVRVGKENVIICKPTTYMNRSGVAVRQLVDYFSLVTEDILIICDDFNLDFGTLRYRVKGRDGGHNGLKSIIYQLQTEEFCRLRFGIGDIFANAESYVLENFSKREKQDLKDLLPVCSQSIESWLQSGVEKTMNKYNRNLLTKMDDGD